MLDNHSECPLCHNNASKKQIDGIGGRFYFLCPNCSLIYADSRFLPNANDEKERYQKHNNQINNSGYVSFLSAAIEPAMPFITAPSVGLDYGCGPNPVLAEILSQKGFPCDIYDPFFFPKIDNAKKYNFIFATECFEHFHHPAIEINNIVSQLADNGIIIVMTELWSNEIDFAKWHYIRDITHVCFFNINTMNYIATKFNLKIIYQNNKNIVIFRKEDNT